MTTSAPTCSPLELKGAIMGYLDSLHTVYAYLMVSTVIGTLLLPFLFALFYFSSPRQWRTPMFICVVLSVATAIAYAIAEDVLQLKIMTGATGGFRELVVAIAVLQDMPNFLADCALLFRILAVYPSSDTSFGKRIAIITPAILLKVVRIFTMVALAINQPSMASDSSFTLTETERIYMVLGRFANAIDNMYASGIFLFKLHRIVRPNDDLGRVSTRSGDSVTKRIQALFWLALSSFAIPVPIIIAQAALTLVNNVQSLSYFMLQDIITFTSAICIAYATIFMASTGEHREASRKYSDATAYAVTPRSRLEFKHSNQGYSVDTESTAGSGIKSANYPMQVRVDRAEYNAQ